MSFRSDTRACDTLEQILTLLDETRLRTEIDEPIDAAAETFYVEQSQPVSHERFHQALAGFVRHVYRDTLRPARMLSPAQAGAEAIALLEMGYGQRGRGYDAALVDAVDPRHDGMNLALAQLAEVIKQHERRKHRRWVFASSLGPLAWPDRCKVAEALLQRLRPFLPPRLQHCVGAQLVDEIPDLTVTHLGINVLLRRMCDSGASLRNI